MSKRRTADTGVTGRRPSLVKASAKLQKEIDRSPGAPEQLPTELRPEEIAMRPEVFQLREALPAHSQAHAERLAAILRGNHGRPLDPILVFWVGYEWAVIEGHHRLAAYKLVGWNQPVPVEVFEGTLSEAIEAALEGNTKEKLLMSQEEKLNAAWRLVCRGEGAHSKAAICRATGVGDGTVAHMRRVFKALVADGEERKADVMTWKQARTRTNGGSDKVFNADAAAKKIADGLARAFPGGRLTRDVEVLMKALAIYDPYKADYWMGKDEGEVSTVDDDDGHARPDGLAQSTRRMRSALGATGGAIDH